METGADPRFFPLRPRAADLSRLARLSPSRCRTVGLAALRSRAPPLGRPRGEGGGKLRPPVGDDPRVHCRPPPTPAQRGRPAGRGRAADDEGPRPGCARRRARRGGGVSAASVRAAVAGGGHRIRGTRSGTQHARRLAAIRRSHHRHPEELPAGLVPALSAKLDPGGGPRQRGQIMEVREGPETPAQIKAGAGLGGDL